MSTQLHPLSFNAAVSKELDWSKQLKNFFQGKPTYLVSTVSETLTINCKQELNPLLKIVNVVAPGFVVNPILVIHPGMRRTQSSFNQTMNGQKEDLSSLDEADYRILECTVKVDPALNARLRYSPAWCILGVGLSTGIGMADTFGPLSDSIGFMVLALFVLIGMGSWGVSCLRFKRAKDSYRSLLSQAMNIRVGTYTWQ